MANKAIKWAWDDDEDEVDLLSTGEVPKGLQKIAPEEKVEGLSNNEIKEQLLSGDLKLPKEFRSTLDLDLSESEESEIRAKHRKYEDWAYESERDYIDTNDSNKSIHSIVENDSEVSESDIEEANNLLQKRIDRLKLKQVTNEVTDEVIISSSGMSLSDYLNKTYLRGNKGRKRKREFNRREEDIARLESRKNDPLYAKGVVKHLEQVERRKLAKVKQTQAIRKAYNKDRYTKMSPNEKQLLKSLGMTEQELISRVGYNSILDEKEKDYRFGDSGPKYLMKGPRSNFAVVRFNPGQDFPAHYHEIMEENFYVLEGKIDIYVDDAKVTLSKGEFIHIEPNEVHYVKNPYDEPIVMVSTLAPFQEVDKIEAPDFKPED